MVDRVLKFILLATPIAYLGGMPMRQFDIHFFYIGVIALFIASLFDKPVRELPGKSMMAALLGLCLFNVLMWRMRPVTVASTVNIFMGVFALSIIVRYCKDPRSCYKYMVIAGMVNIAAWGLQRAGYLQIFETVFGTDAGGMMGNTPRLVGYLTIVMAFMMSFSIWFLVPCMVVSVITHEITLLVVVAAILFWKIKQDYIRIWTLLISLVGALYYWGPITRSLRTRLDTWQHAFSNFFSNPMIGYGLGGLKFSNPHPGTHVDSTILGSYAQFIACIGILGAVWLFFVLKSYKDNFNGSTESMGVMSIVILSTVEYPFEIGRLWFTLIAIIGFFLIHLQNKEETNGRTEDD